MSKEYFDMDMMDQLCGCVGETVTIFTTSGGESGAGFTGVVIATNDCYVRLLTRFGSAPDCALGNACCNPCRKNYNRGECGYKKFGSVIDIPMDKIAAFVHNAV